MKAMYIFTYFSFIWLACTVPVLWAVYLGHGRPPKIWILRTVVGLTFAALIVAGVLIAGVIYSMPTAMVAVLATILTLVDLVAMVLISIFWRACLMMMVHLIFNMDDSM